MKGLKGGTALFCILMPDPKLTSVWFLTFAVILAVSVYFMRLLPTPWISGFVAVFVFAMWCDRILYCASTLFLRAFVLRNRRAFEAFAEGITIREAV